MISFLLSRECLFHRLSGCYCPGCGGTRSLYFFLHGNWGKSLLYHPLVLYTFFAVLYNGCRYLISFIQKKKAVSYSPYHPSTLWLWIALLLLITNTVVKNVFLVILHIDLLSFQL